MTSRRTTLRKATKTALMLLCTSCLLIGSASWLGAQPPQGRGGRGGPGSNWAAMREAMRKAPEKEILELLRHPPIAVEIGIDDDVRKKVEQLRSEAFRELLGSLKLPADQRVPRIVEIYKNQGKAAMNLLREQVGEEAIERLEGLFAQTRKAEAITNAIIAGRVGLTEEELNQFRALADEERSKQNVREQFEKIMRIPDLDYQEKRQRIDKLSKRMREKLNGTLLGSLTEQQRLKFEKVKGPAFADLPKRGPGGPPRGRPGGGRPDGGMEGPEGPGRPDGPGRGRGEGAARGERGKRDRGRPESDSEGKSKANCNCGFRQEAEHCL